MHLHSSRQVNFPSWTESSTTNSDSCWEQGLHTHALTCHHLCELGLQPSKPPRTAAEYKLHEPTTPCWPHCRSMGVYWVGARHMPCCWTVPQLPLSLAAGSKAPCTPARVCQAWTTRHCGQQATATKLQRSFLAGASRPSPGPSTGSRRNTLKRNFCNAC